ncbi:transmembrane protein DUF3566 [Kineococcus xinjiangensis]|uniref:Transmembrane protein DUF3566 n=1 Tax=Kineococcus xinjiangensis TaxID=512762 RepID=A0A2S6II59_9ACTN|nr:DUF3566 domain-containing protein [Kineococcus xinjiangensis]PPK93860.1 transmembrane protein DUF3566 [Kineococcus xinjiangensis]
MTPVERTYGQGAPASGKAQSGTATPSRPAARPGGPAVSHDGVPRRVRLTLARVDPWTVTKLSFLLSVAIGMALVVATGVVWVVLNGMGVFSDVNGVLRDIVGPNAGVDVFEYVGFGKVISLATVVAVVDVVLLTALATLVAFLYNVSAALVGGLRVTLSDD